MNIRILAIRAPPGENRPAVSEYPSRDEANGSGEILYRPDEILKDHFLALEKTYEESY